MNEQVPIKSYTRSFLAEMYGVSVRVFSIWIKAVEEKLKTVKKKIFTPKQVRKIFEHLDTPEFNPELDYEKQLKKR